jgi:hypothetical protein
MTVLRVFVRCYHNLVFASAAKQPSFALAAQWIASRGVALRQAGLLRRSAPRNDGAVQKLRSNSAQQSWIASSLRFQRKRFAFVAGNDGAPRVCPVLPQPRHCERSEAIQLFCSRRKSGLLSWAGVALRKAGLLRRFAPRNDGAVVTLRRHCERSEAIQLLRRVRPTLKRSAYSLYLWLLTFTSEHFRQRKSVPRSGSLEFPAASRAVELEKKSVPPRE